MNRGYLVIRADSGPRIGSGHVMRCLALAQTWQDQGGRVIFLMAGHDPNLETRLNMEGVEHVHVIAEPGSLSDAVETARLSQKINASWIVVDGYHFDSRYQRTIEGSGAQLLFIDDSGHWEHCYADLILNQNIHAHEDLYPNRVPDSRLLLGNPYTLLRRNFLTWRDWKRAFSETARHILVTMGGSDPQNTTLKVIGALNQLDVEDMDVVVLVGPSNPHMASVMEAIAASKASIRVIGSASNMPRLMAWADMAVSAGGSTCWELAYMGLPHLILVVAENQVPIAEGLDAKGVALNLGWDRDLSYSDIRQAIEQMTTSKETRQRMSGCGRALVDGGGAERVVRHMDNRTIRFRDVRSDDCRLLWEWANEADVRSVSFSPAPVPWEDHVQWLSSRIIDPDCVFYIVVNGDETPVGQVRYDLKGNEAVISVSIDKKCRGRGYGHLAIRLSAKKLFCVSKVEIVYAYVKPENANSAHAFLKAGFRDGGAKIIDGHRATEFTLTKVETG